MNDLEELERVALRDRFAMAALNGVIRDGRGGRDYIARRVYEIADAMIAARASLSPMGEQS